MGTATGIIRALNSGVKHLAVKRFTLKYPEEKLKFVGDGYQYDPTTGVGVAGLKGRHMPYLSERSSSAVDCIADCKNRECQEYSISHVLHLL